MHDEPINFHKETHVDLPDGKATIGMDTVVHYAGDDAPNLHAFANTLYNKDGGTHAKGFRDGWAEALRRLAQQKKRKEDFKTEDLFVGMNAVVCLLTAHSVCNSTRRPKPRSPVLSLLKRSKT